MASSDSTTNKSNVPLQTLNDTLQDDRRARARVHFKSTERTLSAIHTQNVKITTDYGSVVVRAVKSLRAPHRGAVFVPCGPWGSIVVNPKTHGIGMPSFKGIEAIIEPASNEQVLRLHELLQQHYKKE